MPVTLVLDQGNSTLSVSAFFKGKSLFLERLDYRQSSILKSLKEILIQQNIPTEQILQIIMGSVVPSMQGTIFQEIRDGFPSKAILLSGIQVSKNLKDHQFPSHLGIDRMANGLAAWERYRQGCCVIDFGTATTFTVMDSQGVFTGGLIAPGLNSAMDALTSKGEQLSRPLKNWAEKVPLTLLHKGTREALVTGVFYSYVGGIEGLIAKIKKELSFKPFFLGTGGITPLVRPHLSVVDQWDESLTVEGFYRMGKVFNLDYSC